MVKINRKCYFVELEKHLLRGYLRDDFKNIFPSLNNKRLGKRQKVSTDSHDHEI